MSEPSWFWYATRGLGTAALVVLTASVVLGIGTWSRWNRPSTPGFVVSLLHRNLSLFAVLLVVLHVITTVLDPFAKISWRDSLVPFTAQYRPVWLGLGVVAAEILLAVVLTSLLRGRLGPRLWKMTHWAAYGSWPLAVVHGLGTGTDARTAWLLGLTAGCLAAVLITGLWRLTEGRAITLPARLAVAASAGMLVYSGIAWTLNGPVAADWVVRSGTPASLLKASPAPVHTGPFSDSLIGVMVRDPSGSVQISMRDTVDTQLTVAIRSAGAGETLPVVTIARGSKTLCSVPASVASSLYAVCGKVRLEITVDAPGPLAVGQTNVAGRLDASGPLS